MRYLIRYIWGRNNFYSVQNIALHLLDQKSSYLKAHSNHQ
nr:MAG TPA: hypothetical protein [Caudoviricetes sp.]